MRERIVKIIEKWIEKGRVKAVEVSLEKGERDIHPKFVLAVNDRKIEAAAKFEVNGERFHLVSDSGTQLSAARFRIANTILKEYQDHGLKAGYYEEVLGEVLENFGVMKVKRSEAIMKLVSITDFNERNKEAAIILQEFEERDTIIETLLQGTQMQVASGKEIDMAFEIATCFIISERENPFEYDIQLNQDKKEAWFQFGLNGGRIDDYLVHDFFFSKSWWTMLGLPAELPTDGIKSLITSLLAQKIAKAESTIMGTAMSLASYRPKTSLGKSVIRSRIMALEYWQKFQN